MAKLVEKHHDGQNEQKRDKIADNPAAERAEAVQ
jgi:hypothetical protein